MNNLRLRIIGNCSEPAALISKNGSIRLVAVCQNLFFSVLPKLLDDEIGGALGVDVD